MASIAINFDATITIENFKYVLRPKMKECINKLYDEGHNIIIWTCRSTELDEYMSGTFVGMQEALLNWDIKYNSLNINPDYVNTKKIFYDILIDDRNLGWDPDWTGDDIYKLVKDELIRRNLI